MSFMAYIAPAALEKAHPATRPGWVAATLQFVPDDSRASPPMAAGFAMVLLQNRTAVLLRYN